MLGASIAACVGLDQGTKAWAGYALQDAGRQSFWSDCLRLEYALNSGGFLSLGSEWSPSARFALFIVFNLVLVVGLAAYLIGLPRATSLAKRGAALLLAGGIGNLIDRLTQDGHVIDFLNLGLGRLRTGIFNVADVAIMIGAVLLALGNWRPLPDPCDTEVAVDTPATRRRSRPSAAEKRPSLDKTVTP